MKTFSLNPGFSSSSCREFFLVGVTGIFSIHWICTPWIWAYFKIVLIWPLFFFIGIKSITSQQASVVETPVISVLRVDDGLGVVYTFRRGGPAMSDPEHLHSVNVDSELDDAV